VTVPIFAGLLPLVSSKQAEFLHYEVPGITIPESIRQSMRSAGESESRNLGISIATKLMEELSQVASGVCIMAPLRRYDVAAEVIGRARISRKKGAV
jgi:homocysteine S-methyltransferase